MMTSKFVGYFLEQVSEWQKLLSTTDSVIVIWFEVQRTWSHLESIFIGSEDIRAQLPEHSKQFDKIDTDFKVYMYTIQMVGSLPCILLFWEEGNKVL
jgi:dynein heavy chain